MKQQIFTIGHSNHSIEYFLSLLQHAGINVIADVRSHPQSKFNPDFNRHLLEKHLSGKGIKYRFLGLDLGARSSDTSCYEDGRVIYARLAQRAQFQDALERLALGAQRCRIALMCAEREPLDCHRTILVGRYLVRRGSEVSHILANGSLETHDQSMRRLASSLGLFEQKNFFINDEQTFNLAYEIQEKKIAYQQPSNESPVKVA